MARLHRSELGPVPVLSLCFSQTLIAMRVAYAGEDKVFVQQQFGFSPSRGISLGPTAIGRAFDSSPRR